jgi:5'(3')-deoxyribonucleotidase
MFDTEGFWTGLDPYKDSLNVLKNLSSLYNIYIATKPIYNNICVNEKVEWLKIHLPFISEDNIVFTRDKGILSGDIMIDDEAGNLLKFEGKRILYGQPYNVSFMPSFNYMATNWKEIGDMLGEHI